MLSARRQMRTDERPDLRFAAVILPAPPGWTAWGQMRVTAINHAAVPAELTRICRRLRLGWRIVSMLEVAQFDEASGRETWPPAPTGGKHRCSDIREYRVPAAIADQPGTVTFDVLIRPGKGLGKLGYKVRYRWSDRPDESLTGLAQP